jgi:hypothetical protein
LSDRLLDWAMQLAAAEEASRQIAKNIKVEVGPAKARHASTRVVDRRNVVLRGEEVVVRERGCGALQEFVVKAESTNFHIFIKKDDEIAVYGSYSEYAEISQDVEGIDAFADRDTEGELTGAYVFRVSDIEFAKGLTVKISTTEPVKFRAIFCKYKISRSDNGSPHG